MPRPPRVPRIRSFLRASRGAASPIASQILPLLRDFKENAAEFDLLYAQYHAQSLMVEGSGVQLDTSCLEPYQEKFSATFSDYSHALERYLGERRSMEAWNSEMATVALAPAPVEEEGRSEA